MTVCKYATPQETGIFEHPKYPAPLRVDHPERPENDREVSLANDAAFEAGVRRLKRTLREWPRCPFGGTIEAVRVGITSAVRLKCNRCNPATILPTPSPADVQAGRDGIVSGRWYRTLPGGRLCLAASPTDPPGGWLVFYGNEICGAVDAVALVNGYPIDGEWWEWVKCDTHEIIPMVLDMWGGGKHIEAFKMFVLCGCLRPVNFGRGKEE